MSEQQVQELDFNGEMRVRREKLASLRTKGNAFPNQFRRDSLAQDLHNKYDDENGEMLKNNMLVMKTAEPNEGLPLIPIEAMAGYGSGSMQVMDYDTSYYVVPEFTELKAEFMIRVKGSSMSPKYNSGDLLACKKISLGKFFQWNKAYVLDTEQGALVKRVKPSKQEGCIQLVSDNTNYDPFDISLNDIYSIAIVLGVIRLE